MKNTKNLRDGLLVLALTSQLLASPTAWADIRLAKLGILAVKER